jgi:hypothetical protein
MDATLVLIDSDAELLRARARVDQLCNSAILENLFPSPLQPTDALATNAPAVAADVAPFRRRQKRAARSGAPLRRRFQSTREALSSLPISVDRFPDCNNGHDMRLLFETCGCDAQVS